MANFAETRVDNNKVLRVVVISDEDVNANGGELSAPAETFVSNLTPKDLVLAEQFGGVENYPQTYWKQCSINGSFRGRYPANGDIYDSSDDKFHKPQPYPSWILNDFSSSPLYDYAEWMPPQGWFTAEDQLIYETDEGEGVDAELVPPAWNKNWNEERGLWTGRKLSQSSDQNNYKFDYTTMSWILDN